MKNRIYYAKNWHKANINLQRMARLGFLTILLHFLLPAYSDSAMLVSQTKHNLSVSGTGTFKALFESEICVFCHTPHNAQPVGFLWNRRDTTTAYTTYQSTTVKTTIGQPSGASRLCLSCHDGTIALGEVTSRPSEIPMNQRFLTTGSAALTSDLSDDHPVSFVYDTTLSASNPEYVDPTTLIDQVTLDKNKQMQCTSCHDPHDDTNGKFLCINNTSSALCQTCHRPTGWTSSSHKLSTNTWNNTPPDPWPHTAWTTVDTNGCENCHRPHSAGGKQRLLNTVAEEDNCYPCHNSHVAATDIQTEFAKSSRHPVAGTTGVHDPNENPLTVSRHVECVDCHNPHQVNNTTAVAPNVNGRLAGVKGISATGTPVAGAVYEYQICFKCHGDSASGIAPVTRQIAQLNKRLQFDLSNPSYHPVEGAGKNPNVPSLLPGYTSASLIYCTACHNNDTGPGAGGTGPKGPHGSQKSYLLERQYTITDNTTESSTVYALCYKCHNRTSILGNASFKEHNRHIVGQRTPCSVCHDPHGISSTQGNATNNAHLINFDTTVVSPNSSGLLKFEDQGTFRGRCYLRCHNLNHNPESY